MTLRIPKSQVDALGLDIASAVRDYIAARAAHAKTVNKAAPSAHPVVEEIVRFHDGAFEIFDDRTPAERRNGIVHAMLLEAQERVNRVLSPARQRLAAADQAILLAKPKHSLTASEATRLAEIERDFAAISEIQRHAAYLAVEVDELPESEIANWQPSGWPVP